MESTTETREIRGYNVAVIDYSSGVRYIVISEIHGARTMSKHGTPGYQGKFPEAEVNRMIDFLER